MRDDQTDRDRVLMNIAVDTAGSVHHTMDPISGLGGWCLRCSFGNPAPQFIPEELAGRIDMPLKSGDIVRCETNPDHAWGIAEYIEGRDPFILREIGGQKLLRMGNERLAILRFMPPGRLYTGKKRQVYVWTQKAFMGRYNPEADYFKRWGGAFFEHGVFPGVYREHEFDRVTFWSRAHIWQAETRGSNGDPILYAQPRRFALEWDKKTRLKDVVAAMLGQGFAKDYEYLPEKPTDGMAGCATFTRDSLVSALESSGIQLKDRREVAS